MMCEYKFADGKFLQMKFPERGRLLIGELNVMLQARSGNSSERMHEWRVEDQASAMYGVMCMYIQDIMEISCMCMHRQHDESCCRGSRCGHHEGRCQNHDSFL